MPPGFAAHTKSGFEVTDRLDKAERLDAGKFDLRAND